MNAGPQARQVERVFVPILPKTGITRSRDGDNMRAKILHAGNHRMGLVGVHVTSIEQFKNMTNEQLMGRLPTDGIEAAAQ